MQRNRRLFLKAMGASALASTATLASPGIFTAHSANTTDYKALVCVFLFGGLDCHDVLIPYDQSSYDAFSALRPSLIAQQGRARARSSLLPLSASTDTVLQGRQIALPPEMPQMKALFDQQKAAIVGNVGPLIEPVTRAQFESGAANLPPRLFSHNDQQNVWQASAPEGAQFGWGGLFADAVLASGANSASPEFTTITGEEVGPFLTGNVSRPFRISPDGGARVSYLEALYERDAGDAEEMLRRIRSQLGGESYKGNHILERDIAAQLSSGLTSNETYDAALRNGTSVSTNFPSENPLAAQLRAVANTINVRNQLFASRQIFFVGLGGFDTHDTQARTLPALLGQIDSAIAAFSSAMETMGLSNSVTLFTASDFGRTLAVNGDGTDHGWGGHHFVVGGAVRGGEIYGSVPPPAIGHDADSGGGRLIPSMPVDHYAAELGRWFGLTDNELSAALPNLSNFNSGPRFLN